MCPPLQPAFVPQFLQYRYGRIGHGLRDIAL